LLVDAGITSRTENKNIFGSEDCCFEGLNGLGDLAFLNPHARGSSLPIVIINVVFGCSKNSNLV